MAYVDFVVSIMKIYIQILHSDLFTLLIDVKQSFALITLPVQQLITQRIHIRNHLLTGYSNKISGDVWLK